jgi:hypothetical protein
MVERAVDLLAASSVRAGLHREALEILARAAGDSPPKGIGAAYLTLAAGEAAGALEQARRTHEFLLGRRLPLLAADAAELVILCLLQLERWDKARDEATARAGAYIGSGDRQGADRDVAAALSMLDALAETLPSAELRDAFLSQPAAARVRAALEVT